MNDDDYGTSLLEPLRGEPGGLPAIDVPKAMRDGRRMRRRWWVGGSGLLAAASAALVGGSLLLAPATDGTPDPGPSLPPDPVVPAACTLTQLPRGGHRSVEVYGTDAAGRWQVGIVDPVSGGAQSPVVIWHDGKIVEQAVAPVKQTVLYDINASGVAVGYSQSGTHYPYVYQNGEFRRLKGGAGEASKINDDGLIVGKLFQKGGIGVPVRWRSADAEPEPLTVPPGSGRSEPKSPGAKYLYGFFDLAEDGTILGIQTDIDGRSFLWMPDGTVHDIGKPPGTTGIDGRFGPTALRFGWVYGRFTALTTLNGHGVGSPNSPDSAMYRYEPHSGTWQKLPGAATTGGSGPQVIIGATVVELPTDPALVQAGQGTFDVAAVSADGRTVAGNALSNRSDPAVPFQPLIWRCE
ncbi:hypothetical protein [Paractinoplanes durhamensis]|uniref:Uncharacterized protein n=1 Tax=Paractinoplanes durhamensis TaxID=113563 RepID=A0ABQ3YNM9_9ACTN|nr:hypothetical protein [Actinoplanes durhamensis]GID99193.1 hypothetical protein Adu01nite_05440 [Actinoplanes durhamensis]